MVRGGGGDLDAFFVATSGSLSPDPRVWRTGEPIAGADAMDAVRPSFKGASGPFFASTKGSVSDIAGIVNDDGRREVVVFDEDPAPLHLVTTLTPTGARNWVATRGAAAAPAVSTGCGP